MVVFQLEDSAACLKFVPSVAAPVLQPLDHQIFPTLQAYSAMSEGDCPMLVLLADILIHPSHPPHPHPHLQPHPPCFIIIVIIILIIILILNIILVKPR